MKRPYTWFIGLAAIFASLLLVINGCEPPTPTPKVVTKNKNVPEITDEPTEIELLEIKAKHQKGDMVSVEVKYKFKKGKPSKYYLMEFRYPGTDNAGIKPIEAWQIDEEGVLKDTLTLRDPKGVKTIEAFCSETTNPMAGYKRNSNTVKGTIE